MCAAAVDFGYKNRFVEMSYSGLMSIGETSNLNMEEHSSDGEQFLRPGEEVVKFGAVARTLTSILDEVGAPAHIEFMSLDVEGAEASVLTAWISNVIPSVVCLLRVRTLLKSKLFLKAMIIKLWSR